MIAMLRYMDNVCLETAIPQCRPPGRIIAVPLIATELIHTTASAFLVKFDRVNRPTVE